MLWRFAQHFLTSLVIVFSGAYWGFASIPSIMLFLQVVENTQQYILWQRSVYIGLSLGLSYIIWMLMVILLTGMIGLLFRPKFKTGQIPIYSITSFKWGFLSVLDRLAKPFIGYLVPSWVVHSYYKAMGCKIGWRAIISSDRLNDVYMVEIGKQSIIGSKVLITAHIAEKDHLILAPVKIGAKCLIGVGAQINPGCEIGDGVVIASRAVLPKYTKVPPGEIWGGIPAKPVPKSTNNNK